MVKNYGKIDKKWGMTGEKMKEKKQAKNLLKLIGEW